MFIAHGQGRGALRTTGVQPRRLATRAAGRDRTAGDIKTLRLGHAVAILGLALATWAPIAAIVGLLS